jgi:hypothetical protein
VKFIVAIIIAVVLTIVIVATVHSVEANHHRSQVLGVYDKCLNENYPDGTDCQTVIHDCSNGDSYACHLVSVLGCIADNDNGCPDD